MSATRLPDLRRALEEAAARLDAEAVGVAPALMPAAAPARAGRRRRRRPATRVLVLALLTLLAAAAIGAAATGLLGSGADVAPRSGKPPRPKTGYGVPTGPLGAPLRVADPAGGSLDWGLRAFRTTRGFACVQVGRMQGERFGIVGRDGAFDDDGLFHALPPQVLDRGNCVPLDARGHGFVAVHNAEFPGSALTGECLTPAYAALLRGRKDAPPPCDPKALRTLDYGLLGPRAQTITYTLPDGRARTIAVARGSGAFLIVSPPQPRRPMTSDHGTLSSDAYLLGQTPQARAITAIAYDDGSVCRVRHVADAAGGCPAKGFVAVRVRQPTRAEVATPMTARIARNDEGSFTLHVRFRARRAAVRTRGAYVVTFRPPGGRCHGTSLISHTLERDVAAGQRVGAAIKIDRRMCAGTYAIALEYRVARRVSRFGLGLRYPGTPVASATAELVK